MRRCLQLAEKAIGNVSPNPMVGAVLVYENLIIGEGYHEYFGGPHAEVNCINSVKDEHKNLIQQSTLYVSLEPCNHVGKTGPCTDFIIANQIKKVVCACTDPYEKVNGSGIEKLRSAGIDVLSGVYEKEAMIINKRFFTFHKKQRPYIILKWAQSNDNNIAGNNGRTFISNELTNILVHKWRSEEASIMIGTNTALTDNPSLTTRNWPGNNPVRVVIDRYLKQPQDAVMLNDTHSTIILNTIKNNEAGNKLFYKIGEDEDVLAVTINLLHKRNINSLIVEGGASVLQSFIDAGLWDEARVITNTGLKIGDGLSAPFIEEAYLDQSFQLLTDRIDIYTNTSLT